MADHLAPGGLAVVDVWLPDADDLARFDGRMILEYDRGDPETGTRVTKVAAAQHDAATGIVNLTAIYEEGQPGRAGRPLRPARRAPARRRRASSRTSPTDAGLEVETIAGDYDLGALGLGRRPGDPRGPPVLGAADRDLGGTAVGAGRYVRAGQGPRSGLLHSDAMASSDQTRLLLVEDVPQVAQYIRGLLNSQTSVKLLDVITDGSKVIPQIQQLRPDVVLVDALLQGRVKGLQLVEQIKNADVDVPVIVLTVPQNPVEHGRGGGHPRRAVDAVLRASTC